MHNRTFVGVTQLCLVGALMAMSVAVISVPAAPPPPPIVPTVFNTPHYQAPVRGVPGDILMLPGDGFQQGARVMYEPVQAWAVPSTPSAFAQQLEVAYNNLPYALAVRLPQTMQTHETYALWVQNPTIYQNAYWSEPILINDPRPLWVSPSTAYETQQIGSTARKIRIVGRNLERQPRTNTRVHLVGAESYPLVVDPAIADLEHYVIDAALPETMPRGSYAVKVSFWGSPWLTAGALTVLADPGSRPTFSIASYVDSEHPCTPTDDIDDTWCVKQALADAGTAGGGDVVFGDGVWYLANCRAADGNPDNDPDCHGNNGNLGLLVPLGVNLVGSHRDQVKIVIRSTWTGVTVFTLLGHNEVRGLHFDEEEGIDGKPSLKVGDSYPALLRLGPLRGSYTPYKEVSWVIVHQCRFTDMPIALGHSGFPVYHLFVTDNNFQVYDQAIFVQGDPLLPPFTIEDAVVTDNVFFPGNYIGGYLNGVPRQGTIATQLGGSRRVDFSRNLTLGCENGGWRASHFWNMSGSNEQLLISQNAGWCTSDKAGDGEFISMDGNANSFGFAGASDVVSAQANGVRAALPWRSPQASWTDDNPLYYKDHWVLVVQGPGLGQARRIRKYDFEAQPSIAVYPAWDVTPVPGRSKIQVSRAYWSTYIVANRVDNSTGTGGCAKTSPLHQGGVITPYGTTLDSTVENNTQIEADGILLSGFYSSVPNAIYGYGIEIRAFYATELRGNYVTGEYNAPNSPGGIKLWFGADSLAPSPTMGFNVVVAHNNIVGSDGYDNAAISIYPSFEMPLKTAPPYRATAIFGNTVGFIPSGIAIHSPTSGTVLANNMDGSTMLPASVLDHGSGTLQW